MTAVLDPWEIAARRFEPTARRWPSPGALAEELDPPKVVRGKRVGTWRSPALDLIDEALVRAANTPDTRLIITMAPQEGKSVRVANDFPTWLLTENPDLRIVTASYGQSLANRNGRAIRTRIANHSELLDRRIAQDNGSVSEWTLDGHDGGVLSVGVGAGITGRPADLLIIDDPIKDRKEADSKVYRDNVWDWWTDAASTRLAPGASVVVILTRWHHDDLAGRLLAQEDTDWECINIKAQANHNPDKGETDVLDRAPGEYMESARGRTDEEWELRKKTAGSRTWASMFQGTPTPDSGNLFPVDGWARYTTAPWLVRDDGSRWVPELARSGYELIQSWDFAFKDTDHSDYVVGQVWLRRGTELLLLDQVRGQWSFTASCREMEHLSARWPQATAKFVEDKANGPAILNALRHRLTGLVPVEPEGSKYARAEAVTPLFEGRNLVLPDPTVIPGTAWVVDLTDEARDFPSGSHDDTVDAMSQAAHRMLLVPIMDGSIQDLDNLSEYDDELELPWAIGM